MTTPGSEPHAAVRLQLGSSVHPVTHLDDALWEALQASQRGSDGEIPVLVVPCPTDASRALVVVETTRLPDLLASSLAGKAKVVRRVRYAQSKALPGVETHAPAHPLGPDDDPPDSVPW